MSTTEWLLLGIAAGVAIVLGRLWQLADARAAVANKAHDRVSSERQDLAARLSKEVQTRKKQAEELATFRKRADKAKKRSARDEKGATDLPLGTAARLADFEEKIERVERERDRSRAEREQLTAQVSTLETRLEIASRASAKVATPAPIAPSLTATDDSLRTELGEATERVGKMTEELKLAKETELRMRKRMNNQEQLYASVRAELDVKKDRLRTQEEQIQRLQAMKVVVTDGAQSED
jgi:chromosome segregation ATPase